MPLSPGDRIGPYEIAERIGAGGMGEVYRASDSRMGRDVAIKVSAERFSDRFSREVHAVAALNHPNVCILHDVGDNYLVMELIEGPTLAERIERGAIPLGEALGIAKQIAAALEAAHEKGIVHRDLKPGNIKVKPDGTVKVLDFGLAKVDAPAAGAVSHDSPTFSMPATQAGVILGTAAYMSPEQARGRPVDKRTDIWAFGVVLYEMLAGKRLFQGEDLTETLAAVVKERPNLSEVPAAARRLIERCLEKDPKKRLRDIGDMELLLGGAPPIAAPRSSLLPWIAAGVLAVALGVALWAPWRGQKQVQYPLKRLDVDLGEDVSLPPPRPTGSSIAISPDGTRLVYVSGKGSAVKLFLRPLDQAQATELPGTHGADCPFFSPDGQWVGFAAPDKLMKVSVDGGAAIPFGDIPDFGGASWAEGGSIIVSDALGKGLVRYSAAGGPPQFLPGFSTKDAAVTPQILPGGKAVLFTEAQMSMDVDQYTIEVLTVADGHRKVVARGGASARYVGAPGQPGYLIYVNRTTLFAAPFDLDKLEMRGTPVPILDGVAISRDSALAQFDCAPGTDGHGVLVYRRAGTNSGDLWTLEWMDAAGKTEPLPIKPGAFRNLRVSPDGERVALMGTEGGHTDIWVYDPRRDAITRRTFGDGYYEDPIWSPDGRYIVYGSWGKGIFEARADGSGQRQALIESGGEPLPYSFTPDGKRLAYTDVAEGREKIWTVPLEEQGGQLKAGKPEALFTSSFNDRQPFFSPDGHWLAYDSNESGKSEVYVRAFPPSAGPGGKWQISNSGGVSPHWSPNGHDLLYRSGLQIMAVSYTAQGDTFAAGKPSLWIGKMGTAENGWDLAPDGKRILVLSQEESAEGAKPEHEVVLLENFFDYLRQRAPAGK